MAHALLGIAQTDRTAGQYLRQHAEVFATFGEFTQDSGNVSYGVSCDGVRYFVKTAGPRGREDPDVTLSHGERVGWLRNAAELAQSCAHPALPELLHLLETADGPMLVYPWHDAELLHARRSERDDPASAYRRFRALPPAEIAAALDTAYDAHAALERAGWIACDFYDGSMMYDFAERTLYLIDLDLYRRGPFQNTMGRMFGSARFMAPEELRRGAMIDARTNVFTLGRAAAVLLGDGTLQRGSFRGTDAQHSVVLRACEPGREARFPSMGALRDAWRGALQ